MLTLSADRLSTFFFFDINQTDYSKTAAVQINNRRRKK